jgi:hypothetical protein
MTDTERKPLQGRTYKIKHPAEDSAYYITLNYEIKEGKASPVEIFINTKNTEHYEYLVAITRLISAIFKVEEDPSFVCKELKEVFSPIGGYRKKSKYYNSFLNEVGEVIELFLLELQDVELLVNELNDKEMI